MSTCIFCGEEIRPAESAQLAGKSGYLYCRNCLKHRDAIARGLRAGDEALQNAIDGVVEASVTKDRAVKDAINGIIYQLDPLFEEEELARFQAESGRSERLEQERKAGSFLLTTAGAFEGRSVASYLGIFSGEAVAGSSYVSEFSASITDFHSARSLAMADKLSAAKAEALNRLREKCIAAGADACLGVSLSLTALGTGMLVAAAQGTAVKLA